jgi:four helix bundle protein
MARGYEDLQVWARAMDWAEAAYRLSAHWPSDERFGLISQTRRAAVSIAANIAEGSGRRTDGEFLQFLGIARGSLAEAETLLSLAGRLGYTQPDRLGPMLLEAREIGRMLAGLSNAIQASRR